MLSQANTLEMVLRLERERVGNTPKRNWTIGGSVTLLARADHFLLHPFDGYGVSGDGYSPETWAAIKVAADAWRELVKVLRVLATVAIWIAVWSVLWQSLLLLAGFFLRLTIVWSRSL